MTAQGTQVTLEQAHELAQRYHEAGNLIMAERAYRDILNTYPEDPKANHYLGVICYLRGNKADARIFMKAAAELDPENEESLSNYAIVLAEAGETDAACEYWEKAIAIKPDFANAYSNMGHALWLAGRMEEAEAACRKAIELDPQSLDARLNLGNALTNLDRREEAVEEWRKTVEINDRFSKAWNNLCHAMREMGQLAQAEEYGRKAIAVDPDNVEAYNNLANALRDLGRPNEAEAFYRKAIELQPQFKQAHNNLAISLIDQNRFEEAAAAARYAVAFDPEYGDAFSTLSHALIQIGRFAEAEGAAENALRYKEDKAGPYADLADIYFLTDRYDQAEAALQEAMNLSDESPQTEVKMAEILERNGRLEDALEHMERAIELAPEMPSMFAARAQIYFINNYTDKALQDLDTALEMAPNYTPAMLSKAELYLALGERDKARQIIDKAHEISPGIPAITAMSARLNKISSPDDENLKRLEELLTGVVPMNNTQIAGIHYTLFDAYQNMKQDEKAFEHLKAANDINAILHPYHAGVYDMSLKQMKERWTPDYIAEFDGKGCESDVPVFILGMPRSGTTLTEQIISSHPDVFGAGELPELRIVEQRLGRIKPENAREHGELYLELVQARADRDGYARITDKMPGNFNRIGHILTALPNAKIIHCRRSPLDTCLSCYKQNFARGQYFSYKMEDLAHQYKNYMAVMDHWRSVLPGRFIEIDYEETVSNFEEQARKLIDYVGLEWNDACLEPHKQKRSVLTASKEQVRKPIYTSSVKAWKRYEKQLQPLIEALGPELVKAS